MCSLGIFPTYCVGCQFVIIVYYVSVPIYDNIAHPWKKICVFWRYEYVSISIKTKQ